MKKKAVHVEIDGDVKDYAKAYARHAPMSLGQLVEASLKEYIEKRRAPQPKPEKRR